MRVAAATLTIVLRQVNPAQSNRSGNRRLGPGAPTARRMAERDAADWHPAHALAPGLHLVATPIGNLGDITLRALWVLAQCRPHPVRGHQGHGAGCWRISGSTSRSTPITTTMPIAFARAVLEALRRGEKLALVSDAGTPLVSDPGFKLVRAALAEDLPVTAAPGPSAALTALILSGLPPDRFLFAGFLPPRSAARRRALAQWAALEATLIFFEGPSRLAASLADMAEILGDARGRGGARTDQAARGNPPRSARRAGPALSRFRPAARRGGRRRRTARSRAGPGRRRNRRSGCGRCSAGHSLRDAVALLADETGMARRTLYERALALTREKPEQG